MRRIAASLCLLFPSLSFADGFTASCLPETHKKYASTTTTSYEEVGSAWNDILKEGTRVPKSEIKDAFSFDGDNVALPDFMMQLEPAPVVELLHNNAHSLMFTVTLRRPDDGVNFNMTLTTYVLHKGNGKLIVTSTSTYSIDPLDRYIANGAIKTFDCELKPLG
ncbi:MAG: hypothetical protein AAFQ62_00660 [Pseudomonadota bacterium]